MKQTLHKIATTLLASLIIVGCNAPKHQPTSASIEGRLTLDRSQKIYLAETDDKAERLIDSVEQNSNGEFRFEIAEAPSEHHLYHLICGDRRIPLFVVAGDAIRVEPSDSTGCGYSISGSEESQLCNEFFSSYKHGYGSLKSNIDAQQRNAEAYKNYRDIKREQLAFIVEHKSHLAAIYALYQRLPGGSFLVDQTSDIILYRTVAEAVAEQYPNSPYLTRLMRDIKRMENHIELLQRVEVRTHPDISARDMYGNEVSLSDHDGHVTLLYFWSAEAGNSNAMNADLKQIYAKYAARGFRVYQLSIDSSRSAWINAVQEQELPWTSVHDRRGENSPSLGIYNITRLPSTYLFDAEGNIVARDIYGTELEKQLSKLLK